MPKSHYRSQLLNFMGQQYRRGMLACDRLGKALKTAIVGGIQALLFPLSQILQVFTQAQFRPEQLQPSAAEVKSPTVGLKPKPQSQPPGRVFSGLALTLLPPLVSLSPTLGPKVLVLLGLSPVHPSTSPGAWVFSGTLNSPLSPVPLSSRPPVQVSPFRLKQEVSDWQAQSTERLTDLKTRMEVSKVSPAGEDADMIDVAAIALGYAPHPLEAILTGLDTILLKLESVWAQIGLVVQTIWQTVWISLTQLWKQFG